jgi:hypothetical protein
MSREADQTALHANTVNILIQGEVVGSMQNVNMRLGSGADYRYGIGSIEPDEINHNRKNYSIDCSSIVIRKGKRHLLGNTFPNVVGDIPAFSFQIIDKHTGTVVIAEGVEPTEDSISIQVNQRSTKRITMMALRIFSPSKGKGSSASANSNQVSASAA